jgi:hypothetical protein
VLEIHANPGPGSETSAHAIHEHIGGLQMCGSVGMLRFPALESGHGIVLLARPSDLHERTRGLATA